MNLRRRVRPEIKKFAKKLRESQTFHERLLWNHLQGRKFNGLKFRRQVVLRGYIVDFYCPSQRLAIEVDGPTHDPEKDAVRDRRIKKLSIDVLRFSNEAVRKSMSEVLDSIATKCGIATFSTNPQDSSSSQGAILESVGRSVAERLYVGGNVQKAGNDVITNGFDVGKLSGKSMATVNPNIFKRRPCTRQVFANEDVAWNFVRTLAGLGIIGEVECCPACHRTHVKELRP